MNTSTQNFWQPEFFAIRRDKRPNQRWPDYRRFCVTAYHRIRNYVLVEQYGSDLFVSWLTRCEPNPTALNLILWFLGALLLTALSLSSNNLQQSKRQNAIQPLDFADAKKLDALVSRQVEMALAPSLRSQGYNEAQIIAILTRTSQKNRQ